jgi:hypothetical protein
MARLFFNYFLDFNQDVIWEACNGANKNMLMVINKTPFRGERIRLEASISTYENSRNSFIFLDLPKSGDTRILGLFLNSEYGFTVRKGREIFSASSVGGYGKRQSRMAIVEGGALVEVHSYKNLLPSFYHLTENGWVRMLPHEVIADIDEI